MISFQTFDFFSRDFNMYGDFFYIFLNFFNWLSIFMLVSGVSLWLMVNKRLQKGYSKTKILLRGLKRYGFYVVLSLFFSLWCFNFDTFLGLNEILGAIGVYALISLALLLVFYNVEFSFFPLMFLVFGLSFWAKDFLPDRFFPFWLILPFFFAGIFLSKLVLEKKLKELLFFDLSLLPIMSFLAFLGDNISYVDKSLSFIVFNVFIVVLLFVLVIGFENSRFLQFFSFVGKYALFFYVLHFAVWFKLLIYFNVFQSFDQLNSALFTFLAMGAIFVVARMSSVFGVRAYTHVSEVARNVRQGRWATNVKYSVTLILILLMMIITPLMIPSQPVSDRSYLHPIKGVLSTDSYYNYPYKAKDVEIGFSRFGEFVTPQNVSYYDDGILMGKGLSYDGHEAFAAPDEEGEYYPLEGWFLQYSYFDYSNNRTEYGVAYALYSDLKNRVPEAGRTQNILAEPLEIVYNGARRFVAQATIHIFHNYVNVIDLKQTIVYNKVSKHVTILMDVKFLEPADRAGPLQLSLSRRANFKLAHSLTSKQGHPDQVYAMLQRGIETPYRSLGWPGHNTIGYYDVVTVYVTSELTGKEEYTGFAAYWPNTTDTRIYGWSEWNQPIDGHESASDEPRTALTIGEWDVSILSNESKRFVVVYGIVDGILSTELKYQLDMVFEPWDLQEAVNPDTEYQWILIGRDAMEMDLHSAILMSQSIKVNFLGFDMYNYSVPNAPHLLHIWNNAGMNNADYRDTHGRLHFVNEWNGERVAGSGIIVLGGPVGNLGAEYFNDLTDIIITQIGIYAQGYEGGLIFPSLADSESYAIVSACKDLNNTFSFIVWGLSAEDTYSATFVLQNELLQELRTIPNGVTTVLMKFNYDYDLSEAGFWTIIKQLGTVTEFNS